mmetsp:Transcript_85468/g.187717  ORF Transcript_85468/g.187717 Transcript_85468/m.187717 type:complete len:101 (+) Transcript_85468:624-926(+)
MAGTSHSHYVTAPNYSDCLRALCSDSSSNLWHLLPETSLTIPSAAALFDFDCLEAVWNSLSQDGPVERSDLVLSCPEGKEKDGLLDHRLLEASEPASRQR